jgi:hypothetical protein
MTFEEYLISKKIDAKLFAHKEKQLWSTWKSEFEQMHPNSFTAQKLYLINPFRRLYPLKETPPKADVPKPLAKTSPSVQATPPAGTKPLMKPVFKPKPKTN